MTAKKIVLVVTMALLPCLAFGTSVTYSTSVSASGPGTSFIHSATGVHVTTSVPASGVQIGNLHVTCNASTTSTGSCDFTGTTITVTVSQTLPGVGSGSTTATVTGTLVSDKGGTLTLMWNHPITITADSVTTVYTPITTTITVKGGSSGNVALLANITTAVPEPSTGQLLGLGTLALMALALASRKLISP